MYINNLKNAFLSLQTDASLLNMKFLQRSTWLCCRGVAPRWRHIAAVFTSKSHQQQNFYWSRPDSLCCSGRGNREKMNCAYPAVAELLMPSTLTLCETLSHACRDEDCFLPPSQILRSSRPFSCSRESKGIFQYRTLCVQIRGLARAGWNLFLRPLYWAARWQRLPRYFSLSRRYDSAQKPFLSCAPLSHVLEYYIVYYVLAEGRGVRIRRAWLL